MSTKLHELLAVEGALENQANKCRSDLIDTFNKKRHLFEEVRIVFQPLAENSQATTEQQSEIQTTVLGELKWLERIAVKSLDASLKVSIANTKAVADIVLEDGTTLARNVPATALLELEKRIADIKLLVEAVPTLDPAKGFTLDTDRANGVYKARETTKTRTQKIKDTLVMYPATKEHPAQVAPYDRDVPIGKLIEQASSSLVTPLTKSQFIDRVEILARAIRQARARANEVAVDNDAKIGEALLSYVFDNNTATAAAHKEGATK